MPTMEKGDILGHEFMGEVVEVGPGATSKLPSGTASSSPSDPTFIVTHRLGLDQAPEGYETFKHSDDEGLKVVLKPSP